VGGCARAHGRAWLRRLTCPLLPNANKMGAIQQNEEPATAFTTHHRGGMPRPGEARCARREHQLREWATAERGMQFVLVSGSLLPPLPYYHGK
jgi:hypothetical protein